MVARTVFLRYTFQDHKIWCNGEKKSVILIKYCLVGRRKYHNKTPLCFRLNVIAVKIQYKTCFCLMSLIPHKAWSLRYWRGIVFHCKNSSTHFFKSKQWLIFYNSVKVSNGSLWGTVSRSLSTCETPETGWFYYFFLNSNI